MSVGMVLEALLLPREAPAVVHRPRGNVSLLFFLRLLPSSSTGKVSLDRDSSLPRFVWTCVHRGSADVVKLALWFGAYSEDDLYLGDNCRPFQVAHRHALAGAEISRTSPSIRYSNSIFTNIPAYRCDAQAFLNLSKVVTADEEDEDEGWFFPHTHHIMHFDNFSTCVCVPMATSIFPNTIAELIRDSCCSKMMRQNWRQNNPPCAIPQ